jgi:hypothetical protein
MYMLIEYDYGGNHFEVYQDLPSLKDYLRKRKAVYGRGFDIDDYEVYVLAQAEPLNLRELLADD